MTIKFLNTVAGLILSASCFVNVANAGLIDFDAMSNGTFSGNTDFSVTTYGGLENDSSLIPLIRAEGLCNSSDISDSSCSTYPTENFIDFDFTLGLDSLVLVMNWAGNPSSSGTGAFVKSYDINGNVLESFGYLSSTAMYSFNSSTDIWRITTDSGIVGRNWWYSIKSINYSVGTESKNIPEPSTLAIFALGMIGLASRRFKKQS